MKLETVPSVVERFPADRGAPSGPEQNLAERLRRVLAVYLRRWPVFWAGFVAVLAWSQFQALQYVPRYTAYSTIVVDIREEEVVDVETVLPGLPTDSISLETEVGIMRSREMAKQVALDLDLVNDPEFNGSLRQPTEFEQFKSDARSTVRSAIVGVVRAIIGQPGDAPPAPAEAAEAEALASDPAMSEEDRVLEGVVNALMGRIRIFREGGTYLINIGATSEDPSQAARIANAYADAYIEVQLEAKYDANRRANEWLRERLAGLRGQLETAEAEVENFRAEAGLMTPDGATVVESRLSDISSRRILVESELAERETRLAAVRAQVEAGESLATSGDVNSSDAIISLRNRYADAGRRKAELEGTLGPFHPDMVRVNREIADLEAQIRVEELRVVANLENEVRLLRRQADALSRSEREAMDELAEDNRSLVRLRELERNANSVRTLYESFLSRYRETSEQAGLEQSDVRIISRATTPRAPSFPDKSGMMTRSIVFALALGIGLVVLLEMLENSFRSDEDVERMLGMPALGSIPKLNKRDLKVEGRQIEPEDYLIARPFSTFAESFRVLKSSILLSNIDHAPKTILITSAVPGEGKTLSAVNFARSLALGGADVLLIDADLRRRILTERLGLAPRVGMLEVLTKTAALNDALLPDQDTGMMTLPLSDAKLPTADVFASRAFVALLEEVKARFEVVVIDSAPVLAVTDALTLAQRVDAVVMMTQWGKTPRGAVRKALDDLRRFDAPIAGVCLTQVNPQAQAKYGAAYYKKDDRYFAN